MTEPASASRSLARASVIGAAAAFLLFLLLLTYGRPWDLLPRETLGNFYDAQAQSFTDGHLTVDPDEVSFEGFLVDGRTYEYQGPVPTVMRLPMVAFTDRFHGRLTRVSMLAAYAVTLMFLVRLQLLARRAVRGGTPVGSDEPVWAGITTFALGASSLLFLASKAWVYHEALLWGVAFSLGCFLHLGSWLVPPDDPHDTRAVARWNGTRDVILAALFAGLALLTRSAVGAGPMAVLVLCGAVQVVRWWLVRGSTAADGVEPGPAPSLRSDPTDTTDATDPGRVRSGRERWADRLEGLAGWRRTTSAGLAVLVLGVLVPVGIYAAVNEAKFGTMFSLPADKQVLVKYDPARQAFFASNGNSLFGLKYVPSVGLQAIRPDAVAIGGPFPFLSFPHDRPTALGDTLFAERDWSSSATDSEPLLVLLGLLGIAALMAPRRLAPDGDVATLRLPVLGAVAGGAGFFAIGYIANRYMNDLFPLVALTAVIGVQVLGSLARGWPPVVRHVVLPIALGALALWGAWANLSLGLEYQRVIAPGTSAEQRAEWLRLQTHFGDKPTVARVALLAPLPADPARGAVAVVGDCDAVYRSNGAIWIPIEGGSRAGRFTGTLTLPAVPTSEVTLLSGSAAAGENRLVITPAADGTVRFAAVTTTAGTETRSLPGPAVTLEPGRPYPVDITFDWRSGYAEVLQGDHEWLASNLAMVPAVPAPDPSFPGTLTVDPSSTRTCRALGS